MDLYDSSHWDDFDKPKPLLYLVLRGAIAGLYNYGPGRPWPAEFN